MIWSLFSLLLFTGTLVAESSVSSTDHLQYFRRLEIKATETIDEATCIGCSVTVNGNFADVSDWFGWPDGAWPSDIRD